MGLTEPDRHTAGLRTRIMAAARDVFLLGPPERATMDSVAQAAGMSKKTIYRVFSSQFELLRALIEEGVADNPPVRAPATQSDLEPELADILGRILKLVADPGSNALLRLIFIELRRYPHLIQHAPQRSRGHEYVASWLTATRDAGHIEFDDVDEAATMLLGMTLQDLPMKMMLGMDSDLDAETLSRRCREAARVFLVGCGARRPAD
ncbi:TetR family transcriptional regulator [bacterium]|nr:TetR family transcriptional regulator [bacterium]